MVDARLVIPLPTTARMVLCPLAESDIDDLRRLDSDPLVRQYVTDEPAADAEQFRGEILPRWQSWLQRGPFGFYAARARDDGRFLGWFHLRPDTEGPGVLDLGFRLNQSEWGRGLATEGAVALVAWGFAHEGATRITGHCLRSNAASERVLQKAGLEFVAEFIVDAQRLPRREELERRALGFAIDRETFQRRNREGMAP